MHDVQLRKQSNEWPQIHSTALKRAFCSPCTKHSAFQTQSICSFGQVSVILKDVTALSCSCLTKAGSPRQSS